METVEKLYSAAVVPDGSSYTKEQFVAPLSVVLVIVNKSLNFGFLGLGLGLDGFF